MTGNLACAPSFANDASADVARRLVLGALEEVGIRPPLLFEPYVPGAHVWRFDTGAGQVIGLLWDAPGFLPGIEWQEEAKIRIAAQQKKTVTLKLDAPRHVYDVRTGEYLGQTQELTRSIQPGLVHLLSALPYGVTGLAISGKASTLAVAAQIEPQDAKPGTHLFHVEVCDPEGNPVTAYGQNVLAPGGQCRITIPFALSDKAGDWTVTATDVLTGVTGNALVKKDNQ